MGLLSEIGSTPGVGPDQLTRNRLIFGDLGQSVRHDHFVCDQLGSLRHLVRLVAATLEDRTDKFGHHGHHGGCGVRKVRSALDLGARQAWDYAASCS
jgi:hypothetical protein